jgi:hypothetical protein
MLPVQKQPVETLPGDMGGDFWMGDLDEGAEKGSPGAKAIMERGLGHRMLHP